MFIHVEHVHMHLGRGMDRLNYGSVTRLGRCEPNTLSQVCVTISVADCLDKCGRNAMLFWGSSLDFGPTLFSLKLKPFSGKPYREASGKGK